MERLAIGYVGRFATTRAKLAAYLRRKLVEREWQGDGPPPVEAIVARFTAAGYIDDTSFAQARAASYQRRGYGERRLAERLRADGIQDEDAAVAREAAVANAMEAALAFARKRRIGPFASEVSDQDGRRRALAAMLRAGHPMDLARRIVLSAPGDVPDGIT
ncbi:regulatory protein RecX [Sphingomonas sp. DBB INV C78]|uniref:regulatory protein RecX n=1 Tax=Sphingomonas sp. DBB INV C78 TaxID=3349434 RepID=UPI0036D33D6B